MPEGFIFDNSAPSAFSSSSKKNAEILAHLNSKSAVYALRVLNPTLNMTTGTVSMLPALAAPAGSSEIAERCIDFSKNDWDAYERSWDFGRPRLLDCDLRGNSFTLASSYLAWINESREDIAEVRRLEEENNRLFIGA
jgi:hypothetical protein